jgi:alkylhydroperoxidase family enzyme
LAWIETIPEEDAEGRLSEAYRRISGSSGGVANILKIQSLHPEAVRDHFSFYRTIMFGKSPLSRAEREAVAVVVSLENECHY